MRGTAELDRLLTQVNCRITSIVRLRDAGAISEREAEQERKKAVEFRAKLMRQIDGQKFAFDAQDAAWPHRSQSAETVATTRRTSVILTCQISGGVRHPQHNRLVRVSCEYLRRRMGLNKRLPL